MRGAMIRAQTFQDLFKRYRRPGDLVFGLMFLGFSLFLLVTLPAQTTWAPGTRLFAQPAFWPYLSVWVMTVFAALHVLSTLVSPPLTGRWTEVAFWLRSVEFAIWFMAYVATVPVLGYLPTTVLFALTLSLRLGYRSPVMLGWAALTGVTVVLIFKTFLQVKVPGGAIYQALPTGVRAFMLTYF